ncbi:MAG: phosphoglycerate dehydrogenase [Desulfobacterales bacterium SG8_35_2]|nr:MAG: phosphoglycerate dehydrogenase [Desulfobacterales bacterium SG8_35_2]
MKNSTPIAVTSRSFSRNPVLRAELQERYSNIRFNDNGVSLNGEMLIEFARGRRKLITALEKIDNIILTALPELEVISKYGVGTDMLDKQAMIRHGIKLGWTGGVNKRSVAELTIAFMICLLRHVPLANSEVREGNWINRKGRELSGRTVGIIGCGNIGKDLTLILRALECKVLAHDILDFPEFYKKHQVEPVTLKELLQRSDIVTLHVPLDNSTRNMLNADRLRSMNPNALLINTARGGLVDENELKRVLIDGRLAGAGFDVFATEPPEDLELLRLPNFLCTPHIGGSSEEAILAMGRAAIKGLDENALPSADYPPAG